MKTKTPKVHLCGECGRKLKQWVYSRATGNRYCWPGEGCHK